MGEFLSTLPEEVLDYAASFLKRDALSMTIFRKISRITRVEIEAIRSRLSLEPFYKSAEPSWIHKAAEEGYLELILWGCMCPREAKLDAKSVVWKYELGGDGKEKLWGQVPLVRKCFHPRSSCRPKGISEGAAEGGRLKLLRWLIYQGCPYDFDLCYAAARGGHVSLLNCLYAGKWRLPSNHETAPGLFSRKCWDSGLWRNLARLGLAFNSREVMAWVFKQKGEEYASLWMKSNEGILKDHENQTMIKWLKETYPDGPVLHQGR